MVYGLSQKDLPADVTHKILPCTMGNFAAQLQQCIVRSHDRTRMITDSGGVALHEVFEIS